MENDTNAGIYNNGLLQICIIITWDFVGMELSSCQAEVTGSKATFEAL